MFSAQAEGRLLFKSGHCSRAAFVKLSMLMSASRGAKRAAVPCSIAGLAAVAIPFSLRQWISPSSPVPSVLIPEIILIVHVGFKVPAATIQERVLFRSEQ